MTRRRWTERKIARFQKEGRGSGEGIGYLPWITIHDVASRGRSHRLKGRLTGRIHHLLSDLELAVFLEADRDPRVSDIREQFPLDRASTRGIAADMGIAHPRIHGIDMVMTTDLLVNLHGLGTERRIAFCNKYAKDLRDIRTLAKLEIERRYWTNRGVEFRIVTERQISKPRVQKMLWLHEWQWLDGLAPDQARRIRHCGEVLLEALARVEDRNIASRDFLARLETAHGMLPGEALSAVRHLAANRRLILDLNGPWRPEAPLWQMRLPTALEAYANAA